MGRLFFLLGVGVLACSCVRPSRAAWESTEELIIERLDGSYALQAEEGLARAIADEELTEEAAIQIVLLQSPKIRALFEEIGVAEADLVAAGLLANPVFELEVRYPHSGHLKTNIEYLVMGPLVDLILMPLRKRVAELELERVKREVAERVLDLLFEVRELFQSIVLERERLEFLGEMTKLVQIQSELARAQFAVGNINPYSEKRFAVFVEEAKVMQKESEAEIIRLEEAFRRLLGFCEKEKLSFPKHIYLEEIACDNFEERALFKRLDLQVARIEVVRLCQMLGLKEWWSYTKLFGGLAGEREPEGENLLGFGLSGEIPLFNRGQADRLRLFSEMRVARERFFDLEVVVLSEVREAYQLYLAYSEIERSYRENLLPKQRALIEQAERLYNVMGFSIDALLELKREEMRMQVDEMKNRKSLSGAAIALSRAVGGVL